VNPFFLWTELWLKSGRAMLESLQPPHGRAPAPKVAVIPTADAPQPAPRKKPRKPQVKAKAKAKAKGRRRARR
jgi:hypothetical protein